MAEPRITPDAQLVLSRLTEAGAQTYAQLYEGIPALTSKRMWKAVAWLVGHGLAWCEGSKGNRFVHPVE